MAQPASQPHFRFFDNREKYLQFVTTCSEKWAIAERVGREVREIAPSPPALRLFDAGMGDGTVLASVLRRLHEAFPTVPFLVVGKEISFEDVRLTLEKLPDRFAEHPAMVVVVTNMHYAESPALWPSTPAKQAALDWSEVALEGETAHQFGEQIEQLDGLIAARWQVRTSEITGNPVYKRPSVLVLYRADQRFLLDSVIPPKQPLDAGYDLVIAAQPYRVRAPAETKVGYVLAPMAKALAPGGRMIAIQSTGQDPGMEIIREVWPEEAPFETPGPMLLGVLRQRLLAEVPERQFLMDSQWNDLFRFSLHTRPEEVVEPIGTSTLLAAWNAAVYVAQVDDRQVADVMCSSGYLEATRKILARHAGLWFIDEAFVVVRKHG